MWVGNHLVQVDSDEDDMYDLAEKIVTSLDYHGLFNLDFKKDSKTGEIFVLEMNIRQGRTFYYSTLAGVNLIELAINDLIFGKTEAKKTQRPFRLQAISAKKPTKMWKKNSKRSLIGKVEKKTRQFTS